MGQLREQAGQSAVRTHGGGAGVGQRTPDRIPVPCRGGLPHGQLLVSKNHCGKG